MRTALKQNENALFVTMQHWYFLAGTYVIAFLVLLILLFLYFSAGVSFYIFLIGFIVAVVVVAYKHLERRCNIWIVTNLRLIDEEGIITVSVKESPIDKINNVSYSQSIMGRVFGFGDVEIQTAAEMGSTTYIGIKSPMELCDAITTAQENYKKELFSTQIKNAGIFTENQQQNDTIECPYCAEIIKAKAKICRYCGRELK